jgi:hypothetical protein
MRQKIAIAFLGLALTASAAHADVGWAVDAGVLRTDNAALTETGQISETVSSFGGALAWEATGTRSKISLNGALDRLHYMDGTFDDTLLGRAGLDATAQLLPERITWVVKDSFGQVTTDPFAPATPANRQNLNTLSTGPDLRFRLGSQSRLQVSGRYDDTHYEDPATVDTSSVGASAGLVRDLSPARSFGIFGSLTRYSYDAPSVPEYDQSAAWISWQSTNVRQTLSAEVGFDRVSAADFSESKPLLRILWDRRITPWWRMRLNASSEYQNTGQRFAQNLAPVVGVSTLPGATQLANLDFVMERPRTNFSFGGGLEKVSYAGTTDLDEKAWFTHAELSHRFTTRLQGFARADTEHRSYKTGADTNIDRWDVETGLDWRLGKSLYFTLGYTRSGSDGESTINRYSRNLFSGQLSWRGGSTTIAPRALKL